MKRSSWLRLDARNSKSSKWSGATTSESLIVLMEVVIAGGVWIEARIVHEVVHHEVAVVERVHTRANNSLL